MANQGWQKLKGPRSAQWKPEFRRVDKANRCLQDTSFGRDQYCNCSACREAYRQRYFYRNSNPNGFVPLNQVQLLDQPNAGFQIRYNVQHPRKLKEK